MTGSTPDLLVVASDHVTARPESLTISITSTENLSVYSLTSFKMELTHRSAAPCEFGKDFALIAAATRALSTLGNGQVDKLLNHWPQAAHPLLVGQDGKPLLPVTIRTNNDVLIEAAEFLRQEAPIDDFRSSSLRAQLRRFDIKWVLLPDDAAELKALTRWAELECRPGAAAASDDETHILYRSARSSYEPIDSGGEEQLAAESGNWKQSDEELAA